MLAVRRMWPFVPEVRLYHDKGKAIAHMRKRGVTVTASDGVGAQTWYNEDEVEAVVLMGYRGDANEERALLVHEAVHVILEHFERYLGEDDIGEEFLAYGVQVIARELMAAHDKWCKKHSCEEVSE
jgi:hypothetical protein